MALLDELIERLSGLPEEARKELEKQAASVTAGMPWMPNPGPQTDAYFSPADVLLYGGQGGGGKSDLLLGLGLTAHRKSLIMRRKYANLGGILQRVVEIGGRDGLKASPPPRFTSADGRIIEFGAAQYLGDEQDWQGQPHDLLGFDEATQFLELQVRFLMGWVRSTDPTVRTRTVLATNPPLSAEGDWIIGMFRPWLDLTHPRPAKPGELRWFVTDPDGKDMEVEGPTPVEVGGMTLVPRSRTFIPAALSDNPFLKETGYQAQLDGLPEPLRSAVRDGNFMATREDAHNQIIPTAWVIAAQQRWTPQPPAGIPMCAMGVDASGGGRDPMSIARRHDGWYAPMVRVEGKDIPQDRIGTHCAGVVISYRRDDAKVIVDMGGGYGGGIYEHLSANGVSVHGYKGSAQTRERTKDRQLGFVNYRSQTLWRFREALDPDQAGGSPIALPPDPLLMADLTTPTWEAVSLRGGMAIRAESKEDVVDRLGRSPDDGDAVVMAWSDGGRMATHGPIWRDSVNRHLGRAPKVIRRA